VLDKLDAQRLKLFHGENFQELSRLDIVKRLSEKPYYVADIQKVTLEERVFSR
jgi:hypothetical protein